MTRRCWGCMREYDGRYDVCPYCGFVNGEEAEFEYHLQPGTILDNRYQVGKVLGFGGFGITYIGWDSLLERKVAIKEYLPSNCATRTVSQTHLIIFQGDKEIKFRNGLVKFQEEAKRLAKFQEIDGIVQIYDCVLDNNTAYIVMEYLEGETLRERLKREKRIPVDEAINLMKPVLKALVAVHEIGIIHRDIAPDNVFLYKSENGEIKAKLLDFGAARFAVTSQSTSLSVLVKEGYSPVEQYSSQGKQGSWSDVYAVAATLYHMITGEIPQKAMERYSKDEIKKPSKLGVEIKRSTEIAILNAMNVNQENRTQTANEFLDELEADQVRRVRDVIVRTDIGRWPRWLKITAGGFATAVTGFIVLLLTGVIHFDILTFGDSTVPNGMARVPNFINMNAEKASQKAEKTRLVFQILDKQYSNEIPESKILSQSHLAGSIIAQESTIGVIVSAGVEKVFVPDVTDFMQDVAINKLMDAKLDYSITTIVSDVAPGGVVSQSIEADTPVDSGTVVELVISLGIDFDMSAVSNVPNVVGMTYAEAKEVLLEKGLYIVKSEVVYSETIPKGEIVEQDIVSDSLVPQNSIIRVKVSSGRGMARIPDVQYKTLDEAREMLENAGFIIAVKYEDNDVVVKGNVIRQNVAAGENLEMGSSITVFISNGNVKADSTMTKDDVVITQQVQQEADKSNSEAEKKPNVDTKPNTQTEKETEKDSQIVDNQKPNVNPEPEQETPTVDTTAKVPSVTGKKAATAKTELENAGFKCTSVKVFSSTVEEGKVVKQSIDAGTKMEKGTVITITISKGAPVSQTGVWTTDSSYKDSPYYDVKTKTQYRYRVRLPLDGITVESSSLPSDDSYTLLETKESTTKGEWSEWGDSYIAATGTLEVEQRKVSVLIKELLWYFTWRTEQPVSGSSYRCTPEQTSTTPIYEEKYRELGNPMSYAGRVWFNGQEYAYYYDGTGRAWYQRENYVEYGEKTQYRSRTVTTTYTYVYQIESDEYTDWSSWSSWQDSEVTENDCRDVETQILYYYTEK